MSLLVTEEAIEAAALRLSESASLPAGFARELAKAALEAGLPHCRPEGQSLGEPERFMDEIDAASVANRWIEDIAYSGKGASRRLEHLRFERGRDGEQQGYHQTDGGAVLYWESNRLRAVALVARDDLNYSVLVRGGPFLPRQEGGGDGSRTPMELMLEGQGG